jgi:invasion protein IalB
MTRSLVAGAILAATLSSAAPWTALAQTSENRVAANTDWSVFFEETPKQCWVVSAPKETVNTRDGQVVAVQRGDILLYVSYSDTQKGVVSFGGGYPFAEGSTVGLQVGDASFQLFTEGEHAWSASEQDDAAIIAAMKAGSDAVLTARSTRGTETRDTFSLLGFTAAVDDAAARCQ